MLYVNKCLYKDRNTNPCELLSMKRFAKRTITPFPKVEISGIILGGFVQFWGMVVGRPGNPANQARELKFINRVAILSCNDCT